jgi:hypothetical protein
MAINVYSTFRVMPMIALVFVLHCLANAATADFQLRMLIKERTA